MSRAGPARLLSPDQAEKFLAYPCFMILAGLAKPVYGGSTPAHASRHVTIIRTSRNYLQRPLPMAPVTIHWKQWQEIVIPVLTDERWKIRAPLIRRAFETGRVDEEITLLGRALRRAFEEAASGDGS